MMINYYNYLLLLLLLLLLDELLLVASWFKDEFIYLNNQSTGTVFPGITSLSDLNL